jgi:hypothetical protein
VLANPLYATEANRQGISHVVNRMDWYWSLSSSALKESSGDDGELAAVRLELENNAVHLYKALLSYQMKSVCSYYRNRGVVFLQDLVHVDDWNGELHAVLAAESRFQQDSNVYTNQQTTCHLQNLVNHAGKQEMAQNSEKDEECLRALRLTDPNDDKKRIQATKGGLLKDSYCWVLRNSEFRLWRDDPERSLLWIKGDPGKGKTMLLCGIVDELRNATANPGPVALSFFFCQAPLDRLNNATAVLRGLIYQLATNQPSLISHVRKKYDHAGKKLFEDVNAWVALSEIFLNIVHDPALGTAFVVIDALDECVTGLRELLDLVVAASDRSPHVKWIVSSRNWPQIGEQIEPAGQKVRLSLELNAESVTSAIDCYIQHKVGELAKRKKYPPETASAIQHYLYSNAEGTFLWVALVCHHLKDTRAYMALDRVKTFPPGLDALYDRMMGDVDSSADADLCKRILAVTTVVRRPITLQELTVLADIPDYHASADTLEEMVLSCRSFLTLQDHTIYFVHQSAKDYLLAPPSDNALHVAHDTAFNKIFPSGTNHVHYEIFRRSLKTMSVTLRRDIYGLREPGIEIHDVEVPDPDPLASVGYSCLHWVNHWCDSLPGTSTSQHNDLPGRDAILAFLETKLLHWVEAVSLLRDARKAASALRNLEERLVSLC